MMVACGGWGGGFYYIYLSPNDKVNSCHAVTRSFALLSFPEFFFSTRNFGSAISPSYLQPCLVCIR